MRKDTKYKLATFKKIPDISSFWHNSTRLILVKYETIKSGAKVPALNVNRKQYEWELESVFWGES